MEPARGRGRSYRSRGEYQRVRGRGSRGRGRGNYSPRGARRDGTQGNGHSAEVNPTNLDSPTIRTAAISQSSGRRGRSRTVYRDYMGLEDVEKGLQDGTLFRGQLRINARRRSTAFVTAEGGLLPSDIFLDGDKARNRAQEGDVVAVQLSPVTEWLPATQAPARSGSTTTIADSLGALFGAISITEGTGDSLASSTYQEAPYAGHAESQETDAARLVQELWRPTPKVADRTNTETISRELCEVGVLAARGNLQPAGRVVYILEKRSREDNMGSLVPSSPLQADGRLSDRDSYVMFRPTDTRAPHMLIARGELPSLFVDNPAAYSKSIFLASVKPNWSGTSKLPWGHNVRFVGEAGEIHAETQALLVQHDVNHGDFPRAVLQALRAFLPKEGVRGGVDVGVNVRGSRWTIPEEEIAKRRDLRKKRIFTIDPTGARDLDDALSVTALSDGTIEMGVHIADVTYFVRPNSDLDREARRRATTVYLVQQAVPMLPPLLCEELCSLNPLVDRLTYSCIWKMHPDGTLVDEPAWFGRTVIRSCCKLDYQTAQHMIEGSIRPEDASSAMSQLWDPNRRPKEFTCEEVCKDVLLMHALAKERRAKRFQSGALSLNTPKLAFKLDQNGNPVEFASYPIRDSNKLVEEYMLLANFLVAQQTVEAAGDHAFLRMHPPPVQKGLDTLKETLMECGIDLDISSSGSLHASLMRLRAESSDQHLIQVCTMMATIPMRNAEYFAAGREPYWRHYALNIPIYTHFTSPIRRYADVMVHRILTATLEGGDAIQNIYDVASVFSTAEHCNRKRLLAKSAQERSDEVYLGVYLRSNPVDEEAVVVSMGEKSFTVHVPRLGLTSRLYLDKILNATATYDKAEKAIKLQASSTVTGWTLATINILSKILVRCSLAAKAGPVEIQLNFIRPILSQR